MNKFFYLFLCVQIGLGLMGYVPYGELVGLSAHLDPAYRLASPLNGATCFSNGVCQKKYIAGDPLARIFFHAYTGAFNPTSAFDNPASHLTMRQLGTLVKIHHMELSERPIAYTRMLNILLQMANTSHQESLSKNWKKLTSALDATPHKDALQLLAAFAWCTARSRHDLEQYISQCGAPPYSQTVIEQKEELAQIAQLIATHYHAPFGPTVRQSAYSLDRRVLPRPYCAEATVRAACNLICWDANNRQFNPKLRIPGTTKLTELYAHNRAKPESVNDLHGEASQGAAWMRALAGLPNCRYLQQGWELIPDGATIMFLLGHLTGLTQEKDGTYQTQDLRIAQTQPTDPEAQETIEIRLTTPTHTALMYLHIHNSEKYVHAWHTLCVTENTTAARSNRPT